MANLLQVKTDMFYNGLLIIALHFWPWTGQRSSSRTWKSRKRL